jgi:hypothetical protein
VVAEELADQGRLPDPRGSPDQRDAGAVRMDLCEKGVQDIQLGLPPDEAIILCRARIGGAAR